jgi:hypothetical protein
VRHEHEIVGVYERVGFFGCFTHASAAGNVEKVFVRFIEMITAEVGIVIFGVNASTGEHPSAAGEIDLGIASSEKNFNSTSTVGGVTNKYNGGSGNGDLFNLGLCPFFGSIAFRFVH